MTLACMYEQDAFATRLLCDPAVLLIFAIREQSCQELELSMALLFVDPKKNDKGTTTQNVPANENAGTVAR
jgi:hypothetical protein